jgi:hypothetical protein
MPAGQPSTADPDKSFCSTCSLWKLATDEFFNIKLGKYAKTCRVCNQRKKEKNKDKPRDSTATGQSYPTDGGDADQDLSDLPRVTLEEFLAIIAMDENARSFAALVDTQILKSQYLSGFVLRQAEARSKLIERKMWKEIAIEQAGQKGNTIWVKSALRRGVGEDVGERRAKIQELKSEPRYNLGNRR